MDLGPEHTNVRDGDGAEPSLSHTAEPEATRPPSGRRADEPMSFGRFLLELVVLLALAFVLQWGVKTYLVQPFEIPSSSMEDTLQIGDRVLVDKLVYRFRNPQVGDIIVFLSPEDGETDLIKRVVATEGQLVDIRDGVLYVDGKRAPDAYVNTSYPDTFDAGETVTVPPGDVYVMGDNRANSKDSRYLGPQPLRAIRGRAFAIYWPLSRLGGL